MEEMRDTGILIYYNYFPAFRLSAYDWRQEGKGPFAAPQSTTLVNA